MKFVRRERLALDNGEMDLDLVHPTGVDGLERLATVASVSNSSAMRLKGIVDYLPERLQRERSTRTETSRHAASESCTCAECGDSMTSTRAPCQRMRGCAAPAAA